MYGKYNCYNLSGSTSRIPCIGDSFSGGHSISKSLKPGFIKTDSTVVKHRISRSDIYRIIAIISCGNSSIVYKAWHKHLRKYVVIKSQKAVTTKDPMLLHIEAEALKNLKSPYLPKLLDLYVDDEGSSTVLEFIEGESFDRLLKRGERFSSSQVILWYHQLSAALETIHEAGVCHRDIKPANIMLKPDGDICLIDFNAASVKGVSTRFVSRSNGYASPEQNKLFEQINNPSSQNTYTAHSSQTGYNQTSYSKTGHAQTGYNTGYNSQAGNSQKERYQACYNQPDHTKIVLSTGCDDSSQHEPSHDDNSNIDITDCIASFISQISISADTDDSISSDNSRVLKLQQLQGSAVDIDWERSDIYSLGAAMHHILTGRKTYNCNVVPSPYNNIGANALVSPVILPIALPVFDLFSPDAQISLCITSALNSFHSQTTGSHGNVVWHRAALCYSFVKNIIETSMQSDPSKRFESAQALSSAIDIIIRFIDG